MEKRSPTWSAAKWIAAAAGLGAAGYAAYVGLTYARYGHPRQRRDGAADSLLDPIMPEPEVAITHQATVHAPAAVTFLAACSANMGQSAIAGALFRIREAIFGAPPAKIELPERLIDAVRAIGWTVVAEVPEREVVFGTVTQPWKSDAVFRSIPADQFAAFNEPGYVKILWTLRVDPIDDASCIARTDTRVSTTSADARERFRWYWSFLSPGIKVIRLVMLNQIKTEAEGKAAMAGAAA